MPSVPSSPSRRHRRRASAAVIAGLGLLFGGVATTAASPAEAASVTGTVSTGGLVLNVRKAPKTSAARTATLPEGSTVTITCQKKGQRITGTVRSTNLWNRLPDGTYVSDAYVKRTAAKLATCEPPAPRPSRVSESAGAAEGWVLPVPAAMNSGFRTPHRPAHNGMDLAIGKDTPIKAANSGTVMRVVCQVTVGSCDSDGGMNVGGCGWYAEIRHADGVTTRYCHMIRRPSVEAGQRVESGQVIGYVGTSGHSTGPHLHFEIHTGYPATTENAIDPFPFLKSHGVAVR